MKRSYWLFWISFALCHSAVAARPSHPETDPQFLKLPDGTDLKSLKVSGFPLELLKGTGETFSAVQQTQFADLRAASQNELTHPVQWLLMDLENHQTVDSSANPNKKMFGASVSKIFVAGALVDKQGGLLPKAQLQLFADMLVVSSNPAWLELQRQAGGGDADRGRAVIQAFTQRMGYKNTRGFQGFLGTVHGNELTASDLADFLFDTYQGRYPGAEIVWKVMHTSRTGATRAKKYIPTSVFVGGKTGTYDGDTIDPDTGLPTGPDGKPYLVRVRHHVIVFRVAGREYGLAILADTGSEESAALLAGGLYRELAGLVY